MRCVDWFPMHSSEFMPEAEVSLRVAFWLLEAGCGSHADIAIDGAHVRIRAYEHAGRAFDERVVFDINAFLAEHECTAQTLVDGWRGIYDRAGKTFAIRSVSGFDVQVSGGERTVRVECKGGPLAPKKGRSAANILAIAVGQAVTADSNPQDRLLVAVPDSAAFERAGTRIAAGRLFQRTGIGIVLVGRTSVRLLPEAVPWT